MAGLHFDITGDNSNFLRKLEETRNGVRTTSKQIEESGMSIEQMFERMTTAATAFGISLGAKQLISDITRVRGEFQQLEVAFNTMLGSKEQANTLMSQLVYTAAKTPFDLQGVANGAKQLLAYGTAAEDVNETLIRLGDIASGLSIPLNDLVWLYGTTMTQGRLFTQDLRQFMGRGIPLADELAKQFGVTKDKVGELVTAGKIGFPEVQKAIEAMTDEGGKFGGLMEEQSKTITGQISNIEDAIATAFNKIGKENESIINSTLSGTAYLVEHWENVAIAIESAAVAYGTYKAAVMTVAAIQGAESTLKIDAEIEGLQSLLVVKEKSKNADLEAAVASGALTEAKAMQLASLREELATRLSVLKLKEEEAIAEHVSALAAFDAAKQTSDAANDKLEKMNALYEAALAQGDASYEQYAMDQLQTASVNANTASTALNTAEKNLNAASSKRKAASEAVDVMATQANTVANHANTASMNIMKLSGIQLTTMLKGMWATLMANPLMLVAGAVTGLAFALYKVATAETEAETATRMYNEALDELQKKQNEYKDNIDKLIKAIEDNNKSEGERLQAFEALKAEYPTALNNLLTEAEYLKEIAKYKKLIAEEDNNRAKQSDIEILEEAKRKLEYYQQVRRNGTSTTLVDMDGNGWATDNVEDAIKAQQAIVNKAIAKVASHDVTSFLGNIHNMKDNDIISVINAINLSLKAIGKNGDEAIAIVAELGGEFSKTQLSTIKNALETEQESRSGEKNTGKGWIEKYKNNYLNAKKELDNFLNTENELTESEYEKKLKELTEKKDEAEKKYRSVGGVTGSKADKQQLDQLKQQERFVGQLLSLRRKSQQDEINLMEDGTEKKLVQIDLDYQKELDAIRKQEQEWTKANGGKLTQEQFIQISLSYSQAESKRDKSISDLNKEKFESDKKAWQEYFIEFGNYQEKRKNLVQKYDDEIAKLHTDSPEYAIKVAEKNQAVEQLDEQFGHSAKAMADLFEDAGNKSVSAIQTIIDKYETLVKYMSGTKESDGTNVTLGELKALGFTDKDIEKIEKGEISIKDVTDAIRGLKDELKGKSPWQAFVSDLEKGIEAIKKGGNDSKKVGQGITDIGNAVTSFAPALGEFGTNIANIFGASDSAITGITDALGGLGTTAAGVGQIMSGDIVGGAMSAVSGVSSVVSALDGLFGADYSHYNEMVEQYSLLNDIWDELIDKKLEYINTSYGAEANKVGEEALELAEKSIESYRILGKERLNAGSSAGSHSIGVRIRKGMSEQGWEEARKALNDEQWFKEISTGRMESLFDLSTEQLERLKSEAPTFWAKLDEDVRNYLDKIIDGEERIEEIHNQINEQLTQTTFDGVYNNFIDTLMNMKASSKDAAEDISEYFMRAMLSEQVGALYQDKLKKWYEKFAKGMEDGSLTESERNALNAEYMGYIEEAMKLRDELAAATGYDKISQESTSQSSTSRGFGTEMTHEDAGELSGRFTALQIAEEETKNAVLSMLAVANVISVSVDDNNTTLMEIKNLMITSNGHLEDIAKYTKELIGFKQTITNIENSAKAMAGK